MKNYVELIAKLDKTDRLNAIESILDEQGVPYEIDALPYASALGNLVVRMGKKEGRKRIFCAHYDNAPGTPGANDNAAACSILLNLISEAKQKKTEKNLEFVFFDLEESGLLGSQAYLSKNQEQIEAVCNLDMCGAGDNVLFSSYMGAKDLFFSPIEGAVEVGSLPAGDANTFIKANIPALYVVASTENDIAWFKAYAEGKCLSKMPDFAKTMHRPNDTPEKCNEQIMERIFSFLLPTIY